MPVFGRTQYRFGAVVFTLKATDVCVGFVKEIQEIYDVTIDINGPTS